MKSKGGKLYYHCPKCKSQNIEQRVTWAYGRQVVCNDCNYFAAWRTRIITRVPLIRDVYLIRKLKVQAYFRKKFYNITEFINTYKVGIVLISIIVLLYLIKM